MQKITLTSSFLVVNVLLLIFTTLVVGGWLTLPHMLVEEEGWIEQLSAILLFVAAATLLIRHHHGQAWLWGACLMVMGLRELDMHKAFTSASIFKSRFYLSDAPLFEKISGVVVIIFILYLLYCCVKRLPSVVAQLRLGHPVAWLAVNGLGLIGSGRLIDSMSRTLPWLYRLLPDHAQPMLAEELLELMGCAFLLISCMVWQRIQSTKGPAAG